MIYFFVFFLILSNLYFVKKSYEFGKTILELQDAIEDSLNILDERIVSISKILEIPLFFDSPEIRRVHEDVKASRDTIRKVAELFSTIEEDDENDER